MARFLRLRRTALFCTAGRLTDRRLAPLPVLMAAAAVLLAAYGGGTIAGRPSTHQPSARMSRDTLSVVTEPGDRYRTVDALIAGAARSIDMTMYELSDPGVQGLLVDAHHRGVAVRILLDRALGGRTVNQGAKAQLTAAGVPVRWAAPSTVVHQKTITVDGAVSAIMTGNLTARYEADDRDFVVLDRDPRAVDTIESVFTHDWNDTATPSGADVDGLLWSPGALDPVLGLIDRATRSLLVENEEMASSPVVEALEAAARRGVAVTVVMTDQAAAIPALTDLSHAGVRVVTYSDTGATLYIHAKAIVADCTVAFVGSQNFSDASLDRNRELGVVTTDPAVVATVGARLEEDADGGETPC